jgi:hypothetical protein
VCVAHTAEVPMSGVRSLTSWAAPPTRTGALHFAQFALIASHCMSTHIHTFSLSRTQTHTHTHTHTHLVQTRAMKYMLALDVSVAVSYLQVDQADGARQVGVVSVGHNLHACHYTLANAVELLGSQTHPQTHRGRQSKRMGLLELLHELFDFRLRPLLKYSFITMKMIHTHTHTYIYIYTYAYTHVCVCVYLKLF